MSDIYPKITKKEANSIDNAICPDCGKEELYKGPCGGMMMNIRCDFCGSRFNIPNPECPIPCDDISFMMERISEKSPKLNLVTA
jgi:transcription elongation factor Elf1